jgi:hypothetical protein
MVLVAWLGEKKKVLDEAQATTYGLEVRLAAERADTR